MKILRKLFFKPKERVFATIYIPDEYKNGIVIKKAHYTEEEVVILHWGIGYEEISGSYDSAQGNPEVFSFWEELSHYSIF